MDGIEYERIADAEWEMKRLESEELDSYISRLLEVKNSLYDVVECESKVERDFADALNSRTDIKIFFKLPDWFKIETPLGKYNPDWAIVKEDEAGQNKVYLVRETKGTKDFEKLRNIETEKIRCGRKHFASLNVDFAVVTSAREV